MYDGYVHELTPVIVGPAVYVLWDAEKQPLYVGQSVRSSLGRIGDHLADQPWCAEVVYYSHERAEDPAAEEIRLIRELRPKYNLIGVLPDCGTMKGYRAHVRCGEPPCQACREARREPHRLQTAARRRKAGVKPRAVVQCGTPSGYGAHKRWGEPVCDACRTAKREHETEMRRDRGVEVKPVAQCGTYSGGYAAHRRKGESPCDACLEAKRVYERERYAERKAQD